MNGALEALRRAPSDFAVTPDDIWDEHARPHVPGINEPALRAIEAQIGMAERSTRSSVYGLPIIGEGGRGKSHLLCQTRIRIQERGGFFVRLNILHLDHFWSNLVGSYLYALDMPHRLAQTGLAHLLETLAERADVPSGARKRIIDERQPDPESAAQFIEAVRGLDPTLGGTRNTLRALMLLHSRNEYMAAAGDVYLNGGEIDPEAAPGFPRPAPAPPKEIVRDLSQLMSLCGATAVAVDQVDDIVRASSADTTEKRRQSAGQLLDLLGVNLVDVRDATRRTTVLIACVRNTWKEFTDYTANTIAQRFEPPVYLDDSLPNKDVAAALLAAVLAPVYRENGYEPRYPSYPFPPESLSDAVNFSPRQLLRAAGEHLRSCMAAGVITEAVQLQSTSLPHPAPDPEPARAVDGLDDLFDRYRSEALVNDEPNSDTEYLQLRPHLGSGLQAYRMENGRSIESFKVTLSAGQNQGFHVEVRDRGGERTQRWVFKAIATTNGKAVLNRVRALHSWAKLGVENPVEDDHAVLWVAAPRTRWRKWTPGALVWEWADKFHRDGLEVMASEQDLRTFSALHRMESERVPGYELWLRLRRPASRTYLLQAVFGSPPDGSTDAGNPDSPVSPDDRKSELQGRTPVVAEGRTMVDGPGGERTFLTIPLGRGATAHATAKGGSVLVGALGDGASSSVGALGESAIGRVAMDAVDDPGTEPANSTLPVGRRSSGALVHLDLALMARHTGCFAGSGSGKTVLLRRIIESAALQGVSSIVLDPNNDLSRLGNPWPQPPGSWMDGDTEAAAAYRDDVEVIVWTPGRSSGRPLSFRPLPDFAAVAGDPDEFDTAVDTAVASLVPRARIGKATPKDDHSRAVLREALATYARDGSSDFTGFLDFLEELPDTASSIPKGADIAVQIASTLRAAMINDRIFAGAGKPLDPGVLLTPKPGKRARVSVVNFLGLPTEEQRQGFVNQLELALFSWAKRNPANGKPLSGLFVLDEAQTLAPSTGSTVCLDSTLALASQARKYGLGMLFATQSPKGIHNRIVGNCGTHWYGRINAPSQIAAATEVAQNKGGSPVDLAHLSSGEFYLAAEGRATERVDVPMCLTHHPPTAPTAEEILASVRRSGEDPDA
ncbi:helicase HerA domain-containing protein [Glycomyces harbinensis]|uniref:Helicase HerA central domain-containing protein n=1 Tax=Glycomyces harbinensis TaxID=58114 RepID=A0A1G6ZWQ9_9ACTN|nr:DUF87 domain-containing protein [Glycomyces harbinensis]SDE07012.1 protein of unknown function DUF87 [Glycomyces harbinensis]